MASLNNIELKDIRYTDITINKNSEKQRFLTGAVYQNDIFIGDLFRNNELMFMSFDEKDVREEIRKFCESCGRVFNPENYKEDTWDFFDGLIRLAVIEQNCLTFFRKGSKAILSVSSGAKVINFGLRDDIGKEKAITICNTYIQKAEKEVLHTETPAFSYITGTDFFNMTVDVMHPLPDILGDLGGTPDISRMS